MTNLQVLKVAELKEIAKDLGIALSRTVDGKRHTLNKGELIVAIETKQVAPVTVETTENKVLHNESIIMQEQPENEIETLSLNEVVPYALGKLKLMSCKQELQNFKQLLLSHFTAKDQTKKRTVKSKWALQLNKLNFILRQAELKLN